MTITIFYFAQLAEERGTRKEIISLETEDITIQSLFVTIFERTPKGIRFAQNQEYVEDCQVCCNPILIRISIGFNDIEIQTAKEDEGFY